MKEHIQKNKKPKLTWERALPYVLLIAGIVGLLASFVLTYDKLQVLQNPSYDPPCNINPVLSCGSVMKLPQANMFGVPNTIYGLVAFGMLTMFAVALLAGAKFKKWLWLAAQVGATAGIIFMHYLLLQSAFSIHAICPWCFAVWMVTIPVFFGISLHNIRLFALPESRNRAVATAAGLISKYPNELLLLWYLGVYALLLVKFWYYWSTLL